VQRTLALLKPEAVSDRGIFIAILTLVAKSGFTIRVLEQLSPSREKVEAHYFLHEKEPYFDDLVTDIAEREVVAMILEHEGDAVALWRCIMGPYKEEERSRPEHSNTIRAQFMQSGWPLRRNFCHGADSAEAAEREIALWFPDYAN
jgi:nucleoside-diphosphate kinase